MLALKDVIDGKTGVGLDVEEVEVVGGLEQTGRGILASNQQCASVLPVVFVDESDGILSLGLELGESIDDGQVSLSKFSGQSRGHCELSNLRVDLKLPALRVRTMSSSGTNTLSRADGTSTGISGTLLFVNFTGRSCNLSSSFRL